MAASAFARTLQASLSSRTIFVKCTPPPANFTERRAVLRALQQASDAGLEVFKKLEDSSSFIAVTSSPEMANKLVAESPMRRTLVGQDSTAAAAFSTTAWGAAYRATITDPIDLVPTATTTSSSMNDSGLCRKNLTIHVFPANADYDHKRIIARNRLHGPWPVNDGRKETFMMAALKGAVPSGAMNKALCDWETGGQLDGTNGSTGDSTLDVFGHNVSRRMFAEERSRRREYKAKLPDVMKSLRAVAEGRAATQEEVGAAENIETPSDGNDQDASGVKH